MKLLLKILTSVIFSLGIVLLCTVILSFIPPLFLDGVHETHEIFQLVQVFLIIGFFVFGITGVIMWAFIFGLLKNWEVNDKRKHGVANVVATILVVPIASALFNFNVFDIEMGVSTLLLLYIFVFPVSFLSFCVYCSSFE